MATLEQFRAANPGVRISGEGKWLVVYCRGTGIRYESYFQAHKEANEPCLHCNGEVVHGLFELAAPPARPAFKPSASFRKTVESA